MGRRDELSPRKQPRQGRSRATVEAILEAAARVFAERGYAGSSTNVIAQVAGVSIGSLYEYFPNKDALLVAVARRHTERMMSDVERLLEAALASPHSLETLIASFVTAMLEVHERDPNLHHVLFAEAPHPPELHACVLQVEETLAHLVEALLRQSREIDLADPDTAAHLVVQTAEALTHRFAHEGIHDLPRERFVEQVVALLVGYLRSGVASASEEGRPARGRRVSRG